MEILLPEDIKKRFKDKFWVSPYRRILAVEHNGLVELIEDHARGTCYGGSAWEIHHYPKTSSLIEYAKRDGARNIFRARTGKTSLSLVPGLAAAGIEEVDVTETEIRIHYSGLGGAGVAIAMARGSAFGVNHVEVSEWGGGGQRARASVVLPRLEKVILGMDDTDDSTSGATWALANEIGFHLDQEEGLHYIGHCINQLFPQNPHKTQNCVSIAISFAIDHSKKEYLIDSVKGLLEEHTLSDQTGLAVYQGIKTTRALRDYARMCKMRIVLLDEAKSVAEQEGVELIEITGAQGLIGALAGIGYYDDPDLAVKVDV